ncbi:hypothetical protein IP92_02952 [Pseudoduganella flava]|uniref:Catalase n=1 Tax=Pseudoduganella flava TaxID=871742 RepID=A0A562PQH1_9BURK|nr:LodA/GoxA family CTQ-dependent oxidase [Pseudoduganella flava]QGZ37782.1 hypothetical protein GO485_01055 [Pseudoduganella flava]TWI46593.1 hypothetical protein IP92_02952 [Pseudoduganella flava]
MRTPNETPPACFSQPDQTAERITELFVNVAQAGHIRNDPAPARRAVFRKLHGVAHGRFEMAAAIPDALRVGVFRHERLDAWVRFSSDAAPTDPDVGATVGIGIKLFGVPGPKALGDDGDTADFILQNFPVFFADNATEMLDVTYASLIAGDDKRYLADHPRMARILDQMANVVEASVLTARYWAILPFHCGAQQYVKYRLEPETAGDAIAGYGDNYLGIDMARRLASREYRFRFMVQLRTNDASMPLDEASVEWPEQESPFVHVATLILPRQDTGTRGQAAYGEALGFNIWRVPPEHAPVGSIAEARKLAYAASAQARHEANGQPLQDPPEPRPACPFGHGRPAQDDDTCIVTAAIYPPIGIARVGSADKDWFLGPEVPEPKAHPPGFYRDSENKLKRQAVRYRVYGLNAKGNIVAELTSANAHIAWQVQLANTKSAWYGFQLALDIPEAAWAPPTTLRNAAVTDRASLAITPGARMVSGPNAAPQAFDDGTFMGKPVYLGEIFTDDEGHLIVLGGHGAAASYDGSRAITFANNEGWHDDVSDGPVNATVHYQGQELNVLPAWVVVAPPNYGPQRKSVRTMWDLMRDVAIQGGKLPKPTRPSFTDDILPLFERMAGLQWVNAGFASGFGWKGANDLTSPEALRRLSDAGGASGELRRLVANQFRNDAVDSYSPKPWPWLYGDAMNVPPAATPRQNATLTATQMGMLAQWAAGDFVEDYDPERGPPACLEDVPLAERGDVLTRAALEFALADAFHPGCEMTWVTRLPGMYMAPFRFRHAPDGWIAPQPAQVLTADALGTPNGPFAGQLPGGITRWMAVPWHTDTASCRSGYVPEYDPYVPTFWPARVPNEVLTRENYAVVMDEGRPLGERLAAFANRAGWLTPLGTADYTETINNMVAHFGELGVVEQRDGPSDRAHFPAFIEVEDQHPTIPPEPESAEKARDTRQRTLRIGARVSTRSRSFDLSHIDKVKRFPRGFPG